MEDQVERKVVGWDRFWDEIASLVHTSQMRIGHADRNFSLFFVERLQLAAVKLVTLRDIMETVNELSTFSQKVFSKLFDGWLPSGNSTLTGWTWTFRPAVMRSTRRGRPEFNISKDQLVFLHNLSFSWTSISSLLGVSRMTIYRRRRVYNLLLEGEYVPSELELSSILRHIRLDTSDIGQTLLNGLSCHQKTFAYTISSTRPT